MNPTPREELFSRLEIFSILEVAQHPPFNGDIQHQGLFGELTSRLKDLTVLHELAVAAEARARAVSSSMDSNGDILRLLETDEAAYFAESSRRIAMSHRAFTEAHILAEAFYVFAFRAYDITRILNR